MAMSPHTQPNRTVRRIAAGVGAFGLILITTGAAMVSVGSSPASAGPASKTAPQAAQLRPMLASPSVTMSPSTSTSTPPPPEPVEFDVDVFVTPPTCETAGTLVEHEFPGVSVTVSPAYDGPGTYTITATLDDDERNTFPDGTTAPKVFQVTVKGALGYQSEDSEAPCYRAPTPTPTPTITTTPTPEPLQSGVVGECTGSVPFLSYSVDAQGFPADSTVDITFVNPNGDDATYANQPLTGKLLWPGASDTEPLMWPGWDLLADGTYVEVGDDNFGWTRPNVDIIFAVHGGTAGRVTLTTDNPEATVSVAYPPASAKCANPQNAGTNPLTGEDEDNGAVPTAVNAGLAGDTTAGGAQHLGGLLLGTGLALTALSIIVLVAGRPRGTHQF